MYTMSGAEGSHAGRSEQTRGTGAAALHRALGPLAMAWACLCLLPAWGRADLAIVLSTDFETGYYSSLALQSPYARNVDIESACPDAVARAHGDRVYILGRFGCDHVQIVDGTTGATLDQWSTGAGTNPQDIEIYTPTKAYISLYERDFLSIVNPQTGASLGTISLATFSDADGLPEAHEMVLVGDRLFVALQRLDRPGGFVASNPSFIAVIDCTTDQLIDVNPLEPGVQGIPLTGRNPFGELIYDPVRDQIVVTEVGNFGALDGGAEFVDPTTWTASGFFITESTLGGDLNTLRLWVDCTGYAIVNDASFNTKLVRFDRCAGTNLGVCLATPGFNLSDLEIYFDGTLLVTDRDLVTPGVRLFRASGCTEITTAPLAFGLPPQDIAIVHPFAPTGVPELPALAALRLLPNEPNPFNPATTLRFEALPGTPVVLEILDVRGRRLVRLWDGPVQGTAAQVVWNGRDAGGQGLPSGLYVARLRSAQGVRTRLLTLVR